MWFTHKSISPLMYDVRFFIQSESSMNCCSILGLVSTSIEVTIRGVCMWWTEGGTRESGVGWNAWSMGSQDLVVKLGNNVATKAVEGDVNLRMVGEYSVL